MYLFIYVLGVLLISIVTLIGVLYIFYLYQFKYWKKNGVIAPKPKFPEGNFRGILTKKRHIFEPVHEYYQKYQNEKYFGFYNLYVPTLVVNDLDMIRNILIKDYEYFGSHGLNEDYELEPLSNHLFNQTGDRWKTNRTKLSPIFTSGKLKLMSKIMLKVQENLDKHLKKELQISNVLACKKILVNYTMDIVASCAFGVETNCFEVDSDFKKFAKEAIQPEKLMQHISTILVFTSKKLAKTVHAKPQREDMVQFFTQTISKNIEYREKHGIKRDDFLQYMLDLSNNALTDDEGKVISQDGKIFTKNDIVCQIFLLLVAGYETSSSAASCALYELALHPEVQDKARAEVLEVLEKHDGNLNYECLLDMKYLYMVMEETLRLHPALSALMRECTKDYKLDENYTVEKGTKVLIPILSIQTDPRYHDDPEKFIPERFSPEGLRKMQKCTWLPFGDGPRLCLGMRFSRLQVTLALATIISQYKVSTCKKTQIPMQLDPVPIASMPLGDVYLEFTPL